MTEQTRRRLHLANLGGWIETLDQYAIQAGAQLADGDAGTRWRALQRRADWTDAQTVEVMVFAVVLDLAVAAERAAAGNGGGGTAMARLWACSSQGLAYLETTAEDPPERLEPHTEAVTALRERATRYARAMGWRE